MAYTCQNCGASADAPTSLCKPINAEFESKFCGAPATQVCDDKLKTIQYACDSCGSVSADADRLCSPSMIK